MVFFTLPNGTEYELPIDNTPAPGTISFIDEDGEMWHIHRPSIAK